MLCFVSEHHKRSEAEHQVAGQDPKGREDGCDPNVGEQRRPHLQEQLVHLEEQLVPEPVAGRREGGFGSAWPDDASTYCHSRRRQRDATLNAKKSFLHELLVRRQETLSERYQFQQFLVSDLVFICCAALRIARRRNCTHAFLFDICCFASPLSAKKNTRLKGEHAHHAIFSLLVVVF